MKTDWFGLFLGAIVTLGLLMLLASPFLLYANFQERRACDRAVKDLSGIDRLRAKWLDKCIAIMPDGKMIYLFDFRF